MKYRGIIIEGSLNDNRILNNMTILKMHKHLRKKQKDQAEDRRLTM